MRVFTNFDRTEWYDAPEPAVNMDAFTHRSSDQLSSREPELIPPTINWVALQNEQNGTDTCCDEQDDTDILLPPSRSF